MDAMLPQVPALLAVCLVGLVLLVRLLKRGVRQGPQGAVLLPVEQQESAPVLAPIRIPEFDPTTDRYFLQLAGLDLSPCSGSSAPRPSRSSL